jgi:transcriptional regulator with XRE-family HTH domain
LSDDRARPAVASRRLTTALKQARGLAGFTQDKAAESLEWSLSKIVRIESGVVGIKTTDLRALLSLYGITDKGRIADLIASAREARQEPWWKKDFGDIASEPYLQFVEFEQTAKEILSYEPLFVPGILQTRDYANVITLDLARDPAPERLRRFVDFRMERQKLLQAEQRPKMSFVLDESAVRRQVGSADIMSGQVSHLTGLAEHPHLGIRILPFTGGLTYGMQTPFVLMRFPDPADSPAGEHGGHGRRGRDRPLCPKLRATAADVAVGARHSGVPQEPGQRAPVAAPSLQGIDARTGASRLTLP